MEAEEIWDWTKMHSLKATVRLSLYEACGIFADDAQEIFKRVFERLAANETAMHLERIYKNDYGAWIAEITINIPHRLEPRAVVQDRIAKLVEEAREKTREAIKLKTLLSLAFSQRSEVEPREIMEKVGIKVY